MVRRLMGELAPPFLFAIGSFSVYVDRDMRPTRCDLISTPGAL